MKNCQLTNHPTIDPLRSQKRLSCYSANRPFAKGIFVLFCRWLLFVWALWVRRQANISSTYFSEVLRQIASEFEDCYFDGAGLGAVISNIDEEAGKRVRRHPGQEAGRAGRSEEGRRHRGSERFGAKAVVEIERVAGIKNGVDTDKMRAHYECTQSA
jgi:hypothetical protein